MAEKVTYEQVLNFVRTQQEYARINTGRTSKFLYALQKMAKRCKPIVDDFEDKQRDINISNVEKDSKGFALVDKIPVERNGTKTEEEKFKYTIEGTKKSNEERRKLLNEKVDIDPMHVDEAEWPEDIDMMMIDVFTPFVFPAELPEGSLERLFEKTKKRDEELKKGR